MLFIKTDHVSQAWDFFDILLEVLTVIYFFQRPDRFRDFLLWKMMSKGVQGHSSSVLKWTLSHKTYRFAAAFNPILQHL